jgi:cytoskeleton protein RodZ
MSDEPAAGAAPTPGARLARAREGRGWTAAHAAELMRLPVAVVESLEADRYTDLGAAVFARGHLRRYAALLDLPVGPLLDAYDRSHAGPAPPTLIPQASAHTPVRTEGQRLRLSAAAWYAVGLAAIAAAGGGWWWWTHRGPVEVTPPVVPDARAPGAAQPGDAATSAEPVAGSESYPPGAEPEATPPLTGGAP